MKEVKQFIKRWREWKDWDQLEIKRENCREGSGFRTCRTDGETQEKSCQVEENAQIPQ